MKITILYGTESGNSEMLSDDIAAELSDDHDVDAANLEDTGTGDLDPGTVYVFVCSTYGEGDLPASAIPFADALREDAPDLSGLRYAMFGLGDSSYEETYNNGSLRLAALLDGCGASMIGERGLHDAASGDGPEEAAIPWIKSCLERIG